MHAVVGIWSPEPARRAEQERLLREELVPVARRQPGFVAGYWMHDPETGKDHTAVVFTTAAAAGGFKALVEHGARRAAQAGVVSDFLTVVHIVATARQEDPS